jgi:hypothetical protein
MGLLGSLFGSSGNARSEDLRKVSRKLERIESILADMSSKSEDRFDLIMRGIDSIAPEEKGLMISRVEEKVARMKKEMVAEAVLAECVGDPKSYPELRRAVRARTGLSVSSAFMDSCIKRLTYEGRIERVGTRFVFSGSIRNANSESSFSSASSKQQDEEEVVMELVCGPAGELNSVVAQKPPIGMPDAVVGGAGGDCAQGESCSETVLRIVGELQAGADAVPLDAVISESEKRGLARSEALQCIDEHLMITGNLYEPKQGHVKIVRA